MLTIRRVYLYLVSAISLLVVTWSVVGLARLVLREGIGRGQITELASLLAAIIVGLPIFLFHWLMAQRLAGRDEDERGSIVRRIYFYGIMGAGAAPIISNIYRLVDNGLLALVGGTRLTYYPYNLTLGEHLAAIFLWSVVWIYLWRQLQIDNRLIPARDPQANLGVRRLYFYSLALAGLVMISYGGFGLLQTLLRLFSTDINWRTAAANHSAQLLVGSITWAGHWLVLQRTFFEGDSSEERSVLRKAYLYLAVFVYSVMAVIGASALLKRLIELALGAPPADEPLLSQLSEIVPLIIVGAIFWAYHWQVLRQDADQAPEVPRQAGVRRIYAYLMAATGLAVLLGGVGNLLTILIDLVTTPATVGLAYYREQVALSTAMTVVGAPVWLIPWRKMQGLAVVPTANGEEKREAGADERRSTVRKTYLYFYVFVAALFFFGSVGWFIYHILTALLGADLPDDFITLVLNALVIALLAAGVWLYHWWAIRRDVRLEQADRARRLADISVVVIDGDEGKLGQSIIQYLQQDLPGLQLKAVGMTRQAMAAMAAQPFSAGILGTAHYIIGSWKTLTSSEVATAVAASPALKLTVPTAEQNWTWAGVRQRPMDYHARQAVRGIKQKIEDEEITPARELDVSTILAVIGGIFLFLIVAGGLIGLIASVVGGID